MKMYQLLAPWEATGTAVRELAISQQGLEGYDLCEFFIFLAYF
jgi:hypothetical protein